ncbi:MAG: prepilin-type N-terminal cleavage/methylation domain-containing protein [Patescibacteria group bacterium]
MKRLLNKFSSAKGFTLIELLIVITIISALAIAVFVALNPAQRVKDANDARRAADVDSILTAIHSSIVDNDGNLPSNMPALNTETQLGSGATGCDGTAGVVGLCTGIPAACSNLMIGTRNLSTYLKTMPIDILGGATYTLAKTGYTVTLETGNIVTIKACATQGTTIVQSSR